MAVFLPHWGIFSVPSGTEPAWETTSMLASWSIM